MGSSRGQGRQNAIEFASRGADVVINYSKSTKAAEEVVKIITDMGQKAIAIQTDVSEPAQIASLFEQAIKHYGHIDIVVSNSGVEHFGHIEDVTPEEFDRVFNINTRGQFFVAQQAHKYLSEGGRLLFYSSASAQAKGVKNHALYAASKAAVESLARSLATDFGDKRITVNAIAPGGVKTDMYMDAARKYIPGAEGGPDGEGRWTDEKVEELVSNVTPLKRVGVPEDIARVVAFLSSEDGGWINGECIEPTKGGLLSYDDKDMFLVYNRFYPSIMYAENRGVAIREDVPRCGERPDTSHPTKVHASS